MFKEWTDDQVMCLTAILLEPDTEWTPELDQQRVSIGDALRKEVGERFFKDMKDENDCTTACG